MSTNINISVGDSKLLDQARLQQNASRQAQLEKEANKRLSNEAEINRVNALAAQGKDANGNTITAPGTTPKPLRDEPAAIRTATDDYLMLLPSGGIKTGIPSPLSIYLDALGQWTPIWTITNIENYFYQPQGGPSGAPALSTGEDGTTTNNIVAADGYFFPANSKSKYKNKPLDNFTIEFFLRWPSFSDTTYNEDAFYLYGAGGASFFPDIDIYRYVNPSGNDFRDVSIQITIGGSIIFLGQYNLDPDRVPLSPPYVNGSLNPITDNQWQHYAVVSKQVPGIAPQTLRQKLSFYINGTQYSGTSGAPGAESVYYIPPGGTGGYQFNLAENSNSLNLFYGGNNLGGNFTGPMKLHGLKLTPKALYDGNFTPPSRIRT